jgi:hypothetical protein
MFLTSELLMPFVNRLADTASTDDVECRRTNFLTLEVETLYLQYVEFPKFPPKLQRQYLIMAVQALDRAIRVDLPNGSAHFDHRLRALLSWDVAVPQPCAAFSGKRCLHSQARR